MVKYKNIAIIPARGGSKRIPEKNIYSFNGKPMIAWTIEAAIKSKLIDAVYVDTDAENIASIAREYGAQVPFLRDKYADDQTPVSVATAHFIKRLEGQDVECENVIQLMANCPNRNTKDIEEAILNFSNRKLNFQISSFKYGFMNPWWAHKIDANNKPQALFPNEIKMRSQDLPELSCPTGAIWIAKKINLLNENTFYGNAHEFFDLSFASAIDIDDLHDLEICLKLSEVIILA